MNNQDRGEGALQLPSIGRLDRRCVFFVLAGALSLAAAPRRRLTVMVSGAFSTALARLAPVFAERSGIDLTTVLGASMGETAEAIPNRLARGEHADVVILAKGSLMQLVADGWVRSGSDVDLVRSAIALAVRSGVPPPPIGSVDQLRKVLLEADQAHFSRTFHLIVGDTPSHWRRAVHAYDAVRPVAAELDTPVSTAAEEARLRTEPD